MNIYKTHNVCSRSIEFEVENNIITACKFNGGCAGNTQGVAALVVGMTVDEAIRRLKGIQCRNGTSCPDQLATALEEYKANHAALAVRRFRPLYRKTGCSMQPVFSFSPWQTRRARP